MREESVNSSYIYTYICRKYKYTSKPYQNYNHAFIMQDNKTIFFFCTLLLTLFAYIHISMCILIHSCIVEASILRHRRIYNVNLFDRLFLWKLATKIWKNRTYICYICKYVKFTFLHAKSYYKFSDYVHRNRYTRVIYVNVCVDCTLQPMNNHMRQSFIQGYFIITKTHVCIAQTTEIRKR